MESILMRISAIVRVAAAPTFVSSGEDAGSARVADGEDDGDEEGLTSATTGANLRLRASTIPSHVGTPMFSTQQYH
jgi:hypothetical protein